MLQKTKVLVVHQGAELYGSDRMLLHLLGALRQNEHYHIVLNLPGPGPLADQAYALCDEVLLSDLTILRFSRIKSFGWLKLCSIWRNIKADNGRMRDNDIIVLNTCVIIGHLVLFPFCRKKKYIYVHEIPTGIVKLFFNVMLHLSGAQLICNSHATAKAYPLVQSKKKHIVYNTTRSIEQNYKKEDHSYVNLLLIGRLSPRKGHHILLQAINRLTPERQNKINLRIVGGSFDLNDRYEKRLKTYLAHYPLHATISFIPFCSNPTEHYNWADIVIMPSIKPESFGLVALEAMQHACPVIASRIGALPEVVTDGKTGILVEPGHPADLANALNFYLDHPAECKNHGLAGQKRAARDFLPETYNRHILDIIHA